MSYILEWEKCKLGYAVELELDFFVFCKATHDEVPVIKIGALKSQHSILSFNCQL